MAAQPRPEPEPERLILEFADREAWAAWLSDNHAQEDKGVWLRHAKKGTGVVTVTHAQALEEALCFGWIDGQRLGLDEVYFLQRFCPRTPRSAWSQINRQKALELIAQGRMRPPGMAQIQAAQRDGRWEVAYPPQSAAQVPDDFQAALELDPAAKAFFETLAGSRRYSFLYRLHGVKRAETRAKRIADYIERLRAGRTLQDP
jgi:uncharacterized protein YdeI (YjbR/CyaY-like superfamily)